MARSGVFSDSGDGMGDKALIKKYLRYVKTHRKVSKSTLKTYESVLKEFIKYPLTEEGLEKYLEDIESQAEATQERKIVVVKNFLDWLYYRRILKKRFWEDVRPPRRKFLPKWLTPQEARRAISLAREPFNYIFEFLYKTGLRIGELEALTEDRIQKEGEEYILRVIGKGSKERVLRVSSQVFSLLKKAGWPNLPKRRKIQKEAQRISKEMGRRITPHIFRHSFAIRLLAQGKPITLVQALLGHSSLNTTAIYTSIQSDAITLE